MPKIPKDIYPGNGNLALNNLDLFKSIRELRFVKAQSLGLKSILFTLATYRNNTTGQCNPDQRSIAEGAGCTRNTVGRSIKALIKMKVLLIVNLGMTGSNTRNRYYFWYDMCDLKQMFNDSDHELHKTNEPEYIEEAIHDYDQKNTRVT